MPREENERRTQLRTYKQWEELSVQEFDDNKPMTASEYLALKRKQKLQGLASTLSKWAVKVGRNAVSSMGENTGTGQKVTVKDVKRQVHNMGKAALGDYFKDEQ